MHLTIPHYDLAYYEEHRRQGLDYLGHGTWQEDYGRWLRDCLAPQASGLTSQAAHALDIGCACGSIALGLAKAGWQVTGVDLSEAMIALGRAAFRLPLPLACPVRAGREGWGEGESARERPRRRGSLTLRIADAVNLHFAPDGRFDFLHAAQVAEHWRPHLVPLILAELRRVAAPGGLFFSALDTAEFFARHGRRQGSPGEDPTHICIRPMSWWHEQLAAAGWQVVTPDYLPALRQHPQSFISPTGAYAYDWDFWVALAA